MQKANDQVQSELQSQMTDLGNWAREIVEAAAKRMVSLSFPSDKSLSSK
jgi:hypothetical protein